MTDEGREPWSRYVDLLIQEINRLAGAASEDESCRQPNLSLFWNVRSVPIGSMGLVYCLHSVDFYIVGGKCRYIYHTWILWSEVVNYTLRILTPKSLCLRLGTYTPVLYRFKPFHSRVQGFLGYIVLRCDHLYYHP